MDLSTTELLGVPMKVRHVPFLSVLALCTVSLASLGAQAQQPPPIQIPNPGVPQAMSIEGSFVRAVWNNEAYAILGYRLANTSVGGEWMLIECGSLTRS